MMGEIGTACMRLGLWGLRFHESPDVVCEGWG